ncbi:hypothetical protein [Kitasatospora sp. NBC_01266]|nr:hypothetical protein [Kitasatospora sp. NBC_01266]
MVSGRGTRAWRAVVWSRDAVGRRLVEEAKERALRAQAVGEGT